MENCLRLSEKAALFLGNHRAFSCKPHPVSNLLLKAITTGHLLRSFSLEQKHIHEEASPGINVKLTRDKYKESLKDLLLPWQKLIPMQTLIYSHEKQSVNFSSLLFR
jgi:hypothetical protein